MRVTACIGLLVLSVGGSASALEGDGLTYPGATETGVWSRWQGRIALSTAAADWRAPGDAGQKLQGLSVLGDYYFASAQGFRATSGLMLGKRSSWSLADGALQGFAARKSLADRRSISALPVLPGLDTNGDAAAVPYVGFGYSGTSTRGGWGFSADLGLIALSPGSAVKLGRVLGGTQSLDDMLRELRLSPVLQLGVSYSF